MASDEGINSDELESKTPCEIEDFSNKDQSIDEQDKEEHPSGTGSDVKSSTQETTSSVNIISSDLMDIDESIPTVAFYSNNNDLSTQDNNSDEIKGQTNSPIENKMSTDENKTNTDEKQEVNKTSIDDKENENKANMDEQEEIITSTEEKQEANTTKEIINNENNLSKNSDTEKVTTMQSEIQNTISNESKSLPMPIEEKDENLIKPESKIECSDIIEVFDDEDIANNTNETKLDKINNDPEVDDKKLLAENATKINDDEHSIPNKNEKDIDIYYNKECINIECNNISKKFIISPLFVLNLFKTNRKTNKTQFVCEDCFEKAVCKYEILCGSLIDLQPLLKQNIPKRNDFVEIIDSSDEECCNEEENPSDSCELSKESLDMLINELDPTINIMLKKVEIDEQINWTGIILKNRAIENIRKSEEISRDLRILQKKADNMSNVLYQSPKLKIKELPPWDLNANRVFIMEREYLYPPSGELIYPKIVIHSLYYAVKNKAISSWLPCHVMSVTDVKIGGLKSVPYYKVKYLSMKVCSNKSVPAKHLAYGEPPRVRLKIGTRVIALFDPSTLSKIRDINLSARSAFYPGIIAETLEVFNKHRYLIFFDDGYAQYVQHKDVRLVCQASYNVWEDVHPTSREFIHNYLTNYRNNKPMVQVRKGQNIVTESSGKWYYAKVIDVDASLVQVQFHEQSTAEWIYRGSTRLGPLFQEKQARARLATPVTHRRNGPYVKYTNESEKSRSDSFLKDKSGRAVARKSTTRLPPQVKLLNSSTIFVEDDNRPKGKVVYYTAKKSLPPKSFVSHICNPSCVYPVRHNLRGYSPLAKPLLSGWERQLFTTKFKKVIVYRTPCGRRLRNMQELHEYLRTTKATLNVDNFDFDIDIHCLAEYIIESSIVKKNDLSNGLENMAIPCINYYDNTMPPECIYSAKRIPTEGVNLNLDPNFLVGCECEDDCSDKTKCSCWQLTLAGAKFGNPNTPLENVGYVYKRLLEPVRTGIYECNKNCKCSKNCLNRVAQQPLQMKLQVFKTSNRGWGIRCLNDIPKGSFVCIYAGLLLTEQKANEGGASSGDEYFAELDYIEVVERIKYGYESDIPEEHESEEENEAVEENDSDEDFRTSASFDKDSPIKTRLRSMKRARENVYRKSPNPNKRALIENDEKDINRDDSTKSQERKIINFEANTSLDEDKVTKFRNYYGPNEFCYVMDAKKTGNIGRYFNHSCAPNLFVQNVFVDTHDLRFPWVAFFAWSEIRSGTELTWNYNYEVGIVPGKVLYCECGAPNCRGRLL